MQSIITIGIPDAFGLWEQPFKLVSNTYRMALITSFTILFLNNTSKINYKLNSINNIINNIYTNDNLLYLLSLVYCT